MKAATRVFVTALVLISLTGCGNMSAGLQVGVGLLAAGAALWTANAQSESVKAQKEAAQVQAKVAQTTIALNQSQARFYEEQYLQAVASREEECSRHVFATNSFEAASCKTINQGAVCKRVFAAAQKSPGVCVPFLRQAGYRL